MQSVVESMAWERNKCVCVCMSVCVLTVFTYFLFLFFLSVWVLLPLDGEIKMCKCSGKVKE